MNDASRELGAALGVAVLGSIAASKYSSELEGVIHHLPKELQAQARSSLTGAQQVAGQLPHAAGAVVHAGANAAFIDGMHLACVVGGVLAVSAALVVVRWLPRRAAAPAVSERPAIGEPAMELADGASALAD
jgi:hypothetical protein